MPEDEARDRVWDGPLSAVEPVLPCTCLNEVTFENWFFSLSRHISGVQWQCVTCGRCLAAVQTASVWAESPVSVVGLGAQEVLFCSCPELWRVGEV